MLLSRFPTRLEDGVDEATETWGFPSLHKVKRWYLRRHLNAGLVLHEDVARLVNPSILGIFGSGGVRFLQAVALHYMHYNFCRSQDVADYARDGSGADGSRVEFGVG